VYVISPWDLDDLEDEGMDALLGLIHRLTGIEIRKARVEVYLWEWRKDIECRMFLSCILHGVRRWNIDLGDQPVTPIENGWRKGARGRVVIFVDIIIHRDNYMDMLLRLNYPKDFFANVLWDDNICRKL
jgi:hypothetical protein